MFNASSKFDREDEDAQIKCESCKSLILAYKFTFMTCPICLVVLNQDYFLFLVHLWIAKIYNV